MGLFNKKTDPISERERALSEEIAALESEIKKLAQKEQGASSAAPKLRSTAMPHSTTQLHAHTPAPSAPQPSSREPIFEDVNLKRLQAKSDPVTTPEHFNELGVRKYDLAALIERVKNGFRGPSAANPKLVSYLAAGSIQGLRPMRYEKRVARRRVLLVAGILLALLVGIFTILRDHH